METYVVRIWQSSLVDAPRDDIRGIVEHVGEGVERPFVGLEELVRHLTEPSLVKEATR